MTDLDKKVKEVVDDAVFGELYEANEDAVRSLATRIQSLYQQDADERVRAIEEQKFIACNLPGCDETALYCKSHFIEHQVNAEQRERDAAEHTIRYLGGEFSQTGDSPDTSDLTAPQIADAVITHLTAYRSHKQGGNT